MRSKFTIIFIGLIMFAAGLFLFYSIELGEVDNTLRIIKNIGTFVGFIGTGVILAGFLLYFINKTEQIN